MPFGEAFVQLNRFHSGGLRLRERLLRLHSKKIRQLDEALCQAGVRGRVVRVGLDRLAEVADGSSLRLFRQIAREIAALQVKRIGFGKDRARRGESGLVVVTESSA